MLTLSDDDLINRIRNFEDHFVERKTSGDSKDDWIKTIVAFANSAPIGFPCVLYIGVRDNGDVEEKPIDLDGLQKKLNREMTAVYPRIPYLPKVLNVSEKKCLAVIVPGSPLRPHFSGPSYVRVGSETRNASEAQYEEMIARRTSKAGKLLEYKGKTVTVVNRSQTGGSTMETVWGGQVVIQDCNAHFVTLKEVTMSPQSFPLDRVDVGFDHEQGRLRVELHR